MTEKWEGSYKFDSDKIQKIIGHPCTFFTIDMEIFEDDTLKGTIQEDASSGGMKGVGEVKGEVYKNTIYFEKYMPTRSTIIDLKGTRRTSDEKHPVLFYEGELVEENKYQGKWQFERRWGFLFGFFPYKFSPGHGTWEMKLVNN